jgi:hypothetical protein
VSARSVEQRGWLIAKAVGGENRGRGFEIQIKNKIGAKLIPASKFTLTFVRQVAKLSPTRDESEDSHNQPVDRGQKSKR